MVRLLWPARRERCPRCELVRLELELARRHAELARAEAQSLRAELERAQAFGKGLTDSIAALVTALTRTLATPAREGARREEPDVTAYDRASREALARLEEEFREQGYSEEQVRWAISQVRAQLGGLGVS